MDLKLIEQEYNEKIVLYKQLEDEVLFILNSKLSDSEIKISNVEHRIKRKESFLNKVRIKEYKSPFINIRDILGVRVITLFLSDIDKVKEIVKESFEIVDEDDKINSSQSTFGYLSVHLIAKLKKAFKGPRYDKIKNLAFEIQIRTITMHSWANISHYLDYKSDHDIPNELKRDFFALSGLFYVADQHFELFFKQSIKSQEIVDENFQKGISNQEINLYSLQSFMKIRLPDREHAKSKDLSELLEELKLNGYNTIQQLENAFLIGWGPFLQYEIDHPPLIDSKKGRFMDIGVVRVLLEIVDENFTLYETPEDYDIEKYRKMIKK